MKESEAVFRSCLPLKVLYLPLKRIYFEAIKSGEKKFEYRLYNDYWKKRLVGRRYDKIVLTLGYPKKDDMGRRLGRRYRGYEVIKIKHPEFGNRLTTCFAIKL